MTLLNQTLMPENLRAAWNAVAENEGAQGVDNVSIRRWRRSWEQRLIRLAREVRTNHYKAHPLRVRRIPKKRPGEWRVLRIPTVTDRVLQRAVYQVLLPLLNPRFHRCSFGYRPGLGVRDAVRELVALRRAGFVHVLNADIDDFFNQVDLALLRTFLQQDLPDGSLLPLIDLWLEAGSHPADPRRGIPMGSPLSPLLANIFLHRFDVALAILDLEMVRYADDFVVLTRTRHKLLWALEQTELALGRIGLRLEPRKTELTSFADGFHYLGVHFEETWYWYLWEDKRIEVRGNRADPLLQRYAPEYD